VNAGLTNCQESTKLFAELVTDEYTSLGTGQPAGIVINTLLTGLHAELVIVQTSSSLVLFTMELFTPVEVESIPIV
jgi:hypothetical protein